MNKTMKLTHEILLITANVGTLFEKVNEIRIQILTVILKQKFNQLDELADSWFQEIFKTVDRYHPVFIALHFQEVGGKNYKESIELIDPFFKYNLKSNIYLSI